MVVNMYELFEKNGQKYNKNYNNKYTTSNNNNKQIRW